MIDMAATIDVEQWSYCLSQIFYKRWLCFQIWVNTDFFYFLSTAIAFYTNQ